MSYGSTAWGVGPWGIGPAAPSFALEDILATSERTVRVTFTAPALVGSPFKVGAALNLATWEVFSLNPSQLRILAVREIEGSGARQFELYTLEKFPRYPVNIQVNFPTILDAAGNPITGPTSGIGAGAALPRSHRRKNVIDMVDIRNSQAAPDTMLGVIRTADSGDYDEDSGDALLRKMIFRRITTSPGEFFHIPREDFGLAVRTKEPLRFSDLRAFKAEAQRQILLEPDVDSCSVQVQLDGDGVLFMRAAVVRRSTGKVVEVSATIPTNQVSF